MLNNPLNFVDPSGFDPAELDGSTLTDLPGGFGLHFTGPTKAGPPPPPALPVAPSPPVAPQPAEAPHEAAQVGAVAPPVDVGTTGSTAGYVPEPVVTAPTDWTQHRVVQAEGGFLAGLSLGMVPYAGAGQQVLDAAKVLPPGTPHARAGLAIGQMVGGVFTMLGGIGGDIVGGLASSTGIGAALGVPAIVVSTGVVLGGAANVLAGARGLMTTGSGGSGPTGMTSTGAGAAGGERVRKVFTPGGKRQIDAENAAKNDGLNKCENCGIEVVPGQKSQRGVSPPGNQRERDHIIPRSKGGNGSPDNGQILCRDCNLNKSDTVP